MSIASVFKPGRAFIERFRFGSKFVIVGVVLLIPFATLFFANWQRINRDIAFAEKERTGLQSVLPAVNFMKLAQLHRRHSRELLQGDPSAGAPLAETRARADEALSVWAAEDARTGAQLGSNQAFAEVRSLWEAVKSSASSANASVTSNAGMHGKLLDAVTAYLGLVEDNSYLTLDPNSDSFFLQDAAVVRIPAAADAYRLLRAAAIKAAKQKSITPEERIAMNVWLATAERTSAALQADLDKAIRYTPAMQSPLSAGMSQWRERSEQFLQVVRADILAAKKIQLDETRVTAQGTDAVASLYQLFDQVVPLLDGRLEARIQIFKADLQRDLLISAVGLLIALYLFASLRNSIVAQVNAVKQSAAELAAGRFDRPVSSAAKDEIGEFTQSLDQVRVALGAKIEAERVHADQMLRVKMALDNAGTPFRIADQSGTVVYANAQMLDVLRSIEPAMKQLNPAFSVENFVGSSIGNLMSDPVEYLARLDALTTLTVTEKEVGGRIFSITTAPVFNAEGVRLGTVGEWIDRTAQVMVEREVAAIVNAAGAGDFSKRLSLEGKFGFFLNLGQGINQLLETSENGLNAVAGVLQALARGDLTQHLEGEYQGLFGQLQDDANTTVDRLKELVAQIKDATEAINTAAQEIAAGNADLSSRTEEQASSLEETASSMEELSATVKQNADGARQANLLAASSNELATRGGEVVQRVVATMGEIQDSSKKIADIVGVIDSIAFQTNILALNAAVEAARAGDQGRGFAVVASEVRSLAQRSATAAKEIKELIANSVGKVEGGAKLVQEAGTTMDEVVSSFARVAQLVTDISGASREQSAGIDQISRAVGQMDEVTQQNAALVEEAAAAAESLEDQARGLVQVVAMFKLDEHGARPTPAPAALKAPVLRDATPKQLGRKSVGGVSRGGRAIPPPHAGRSNDDDEWQEF